jgi:putative protease
VWKTSDPALDSEVRKSWKGGRLEEKGDALDLHVTGEIGEPLTVTCRGKSIASEVALEPAENRPLTDETLAGQFGRLGGTGYALGEITNDLIGDVMIPLGELNRVRRRLVDALKVEPVVHEGAAALARLLPNQPATEPTAPELRILCRTLDQVRGSIAAGAEFLYCDFEDVRAYQEAVAIAREANATIFVATPRIQKPSEVGFFKIVERAEPDGVLVRNLGGVEYFKDHTLRKIADFSLNVANPVTARLLKDAGNFENLTLSYDLNEGQVSDLLERAPADWFELTLHQHMPMFHMEHCVFCTFLSSGTSIKDCGKPCEKHHVELLDRVGQRHVLKADIGCRNTLFNGRAQTGARSVATFREAGLQRFRIELLDQRAAEIASLLQTYRDLLSGETSATEVIDAIGATARLGVTEGTLEQRRQEVHR